MNDRDTDVDAMRAKFNEALMAVLSQKREDNKALLSAAEYECRLAQLKRSKHVLCTAGEKKSMKDYRMVRKYDVFTVDGRERLVKPPAPVRAAAAADGGGSVGGIPPQRRRPVFYATNEELFDVLHKAHRDVGHGGRNRMVTELKTRYCNVTKEAVMIYLRVCRQCREKNATRRRCRRRETSPPKAAAGTGRAAGSQARFELIDMQSDVYNGFRFVMNHRDVATGFAHLRALKSIRHDEVALNLLDIYTTCGAPAVLRSSCGEQYVRSVLDRLRRHACDSLDVAYAAECSTAAAVRSELETLNGDIRTALTAWTRARNSNDWPLALKFLQLRKNSEIHPDIGMSPYQAVYGYPAGFDWTSATDFACDKNDDSDEAKYVPDDPAREHDDRSVSTTLCDIKIENDV